ncbi:hypothetical protein [Psychrobacter sp. I-STPA6b]|uniref:hypothetical protein n=1 Tax=Psychrobacter sp. I-STPA6b TaxID=2585718 RepID=UPI001D0CC716|nr:hypothetical protein [Psychrobacter sp. I-STPA6b]
MSHELEQRKKHLQEHSKQLIELANTQAGSALKCIHLLSVVGGATEATYKAIEQRILTDKDTTGAYHLALMAQSTADLPIDARQLIELVITNGDIMQCLSLLKNLPLPPVDAIKAKIMDSGDVSAIQAMTEYLHNNPEGYGSQITASGVGGQKDRIVPLSE